MTMQKVLSDIWSNKEMIDFPRTELWRVLTDGWLQVRGPKEFSKKFHFGMTHGLWFILINKNKNIDSELIKQLHKFAYYSKEDMHREYRDNSKRGMFYLIKTPDDQNHEEFCTAGVSEAGLPELVQSAKNAFKKKMAWRLGYDVRGREQPIFEAYTKNDKEMSEALTQELGKALSANPQKCILYSCSSENDINLQVDRILKAYQDKLKYREHRNTFANKLPYIIETISELHRLHPFLDGNGRTFVFLLKNWLYLQQGGALSMTETPNHFTGFALGELVAECEKDIRNFKSYKVTKLKTSIEAGGKNNEQMVRQSLHENPIIAAAQINEVVRQIKEKEMIIPFNKTDLLSQYARETNSQEDKVITLLCRLYREKFLLAIANAPLVLPDSPFTQISPQDAFISQFEEHALYQEIKNDVEVTHAIEHRFNEIIPNNLKLS